MSTQPSYWKVLTRRKNLHFEGIDGGESKLNRVLGLYDLTALGVGSTLGAGIYVLAGQIAKEQAGPSVILSFAIAALASLLAGSCYAEFGARVPKAGSAYIYSYVCIGEFAAFVIGWNLILEYVIGTASVCRGISLYLDTLLNDTMKIQFAEIAPINISFFGSYFDFFACGLAIIFGIALAFGVETSTMVNNFCTCLNISVLLFVIIAGSLKANIANWQVDPTIVNATMAEDSIYYNLGSGGFFPFGFTGTLKGAATCFFGFVGFDCIATTGEEVRDPRKNIPRSILLSLLIIFLCYFGVSTILTLMVPYYMQDPNAPLPYAFEAVGWDFAMWMVTIGGLVGLLASLFGALFPLPRVMYSMADDGLLFKFLGKISPRFRTPVIGSIFAAVMTGVISGLFDLAQLVSLLSIGTLLAYTVVAISITILRYMDNVDRYEEEQQQNSNQQLSENSMLTSNGTKITSKVVLMQLFNCKRTKTPNVVSTRIVGTLILFFCILSLCMGIIIMRTQGSILDQEYWIIAVFSILGLLTILVLLAICLQPREANNRIFRVPFVPFVPAISIFVNIYLMLQLDAMTWIRFGIWMAIGTPLFVACHCVNGKLDRFVRNPRRRSFLKALKLSKMIKSSKEYCKVNGNLPQHNDKNSVATKMTIVASFDEIISIEDEIKEAKHSEIIRKNSFEQDNKNGEDEEEEEKDVIAMLDNVLQNIQSTTIATVHSNLDLSEKLNSLDYVQETVEAVDENFNLYTQCLKVAQELIDDIFKSDELWLSVRNKLNEDKKNDVNDEYLQRKNSKTSILSQMSVDDDPIHSEKFRNKLSQIIMQPSQKPKIIKDVSVTNPRSLRQSKSEADVPKFIAVHIRTDEGDENEKITGIPKAPKFDPVLYNTLGNRSKFAINKESNSLEKNLKEIPKVLTQTPTQAPTQTSTQTPTQTPTQTESEQILPIEENSISFRNKLEAILQHGPTNKLQKIPSTTFHRTKSVQTEKAPFSDNNNNLELDPTEAINEVRRSLKPVNNGLSIYFFYGLPNSVRQYRRERIGWQKLKYSDYF